MALSNHSTTGGYCGKRLGSFHFCLEFKFGHNLTELEITEWALLTLHLTSIRLRSSLDSWLWPLNPSLNFTVKPLMTDLVGALDFVLSDLYCVIRKDRFPKKIKIFP